MKNFSRCISGLAQSHGDKRILSILGSPTYPGMHRGIVEVQIEFV